jgi:hypothetical protein
MCACPTTDYHLPPVIQSSGLYLTALDRYSVVVLPENLFGNDGGVPRKKAAGKI